MCKPISAIRNKTARDLLELCNQTENIPVNLKALLKKLKISCAPFDFSELEAAMDTLGGNTNKNHILGALATNGDKAVIYCRKEDPEDSHRYRFTIAHELGHCCLSHYPVDGSTVHYAFRKDGHTDNKTEIAANIFAGELLIPKESLENVIKELILPSVQTLADIFAVSYNVMLARLKHLQIRDSIIGYNF